MEWLLCVSDHIVELIPSVQTFADGSKLEARCSFSFTVLVSVSVHYIRVLFFVKTQFGPFLLLASLRIVQSLLLYIVFTCTL